MASGRHSTPGGRRSRGGGNERHPRPGRGGEGAEASGLPGPARPRRCSRFPAALRRSVRQGGGSHKRRPFARGKGQPAGGARGASRGDPGRAPLPPARQRRRRRAPRAPCRAGHSPTTRQREHPSAPEDLPGSGRPRERRQRASSPRPSPRRGKESASCPLRRRRGAGAACRGGGERQWPRGLLGKPMELQENVAKVFILSPEGVRGALPSAVLVRGCRRCVPFLW